jgi:hypothetical protein
MDIRIVDRDTRAIIATFSSLNAEVVIGINTNGTAQMPNPHKPRTAADDYKLLKMVDDRVADGFASLSLEINKRLDAMENILKARFGLDILSKHRKEDTEKAAELWMSNEYGMPQPSKVERPSYPSVHVRIENYKDPENSEIFAAEILRHEGVEALILFSPKESQLVQESICENFFKMIDEAKFTNPPLIKMAKNPRPGSTIEISKSWSAVAVICEDRWVRWRFICDLSLLKTDKKGREALMKKNTNFIGGGTTTFHADLGGGPKTHIARVRNVAGAEFLVHPEVTTACDAVLDAVDDHRKYVELDFVDPEICWPSKEQEGFEWTYNINDSQHSFQGVLCDDGTVRWLPTVVKTILGFENNSIVMPRDPGSEPMKATRVLSGNDGTQPMYAPCEVRRCGNIDLVKWDDYDEEGFARTMLEISKLVAIGRNSTVKTIMFLDGRIKIDEIDVGQDMTLPSNAKLRVVMCDDGKARFAVMEPTPTGWNEWKAPEKATKED